MYPTFNKILEHEREAASLSPFKMLQIDQNKFQDILQHQRIIANVVLSEVSAANLAAR